MHNIFEILCIFINIKVLTGDFITLYLHESWNMILYVVINWGDYMIVFNGGLTIEQVNKLKNGEYVIYDKIPYKRARAAEENTFDYVPKEMYSMPLHIFRRYIAEDVFSKQYIFLAKYLYTTFEFCNNSQKKNYT